MTNKKLLGTTLALAILIPFSQANAELLKNFKLSGQIDLQGTSANNVTDFATRQTGIQGGAGAVNNDRIGDMQTRLMLGADWDLLDDVHSKVSLTKNDRTWGTAGGGAGQTNANSQAVGGGGIEASLIVDQANVKIDKVFGAVDTTLGRQYYGQAGDLMIYFGPSDKAWYGLPTNAIDAARFDWANESVNVTGVAGKTKGSALGVTGADKDITGFIASLKANENASASLYVWNQQTHATGALGESQQQVTPGGVATGKNDNLYVVGLKGKFSSNGLWVKGEFAKDLGENRVLAVTDGPAQYTGWGALVDAGYKSDVQGMGSVTGWGQFGYGTGQHDTHQNHNRQFTMISSDYRPGSIYGRFANYTNGGAQPAGFSGGGVDNPGLANRVIWGVGLKGSPSAAPKFGAGLSFWDYRSQTINTPLNDSNGPISLFAAQSNQLAANGGNKHLGSEIDVDLTWKHSDNVSFGAGWGTFQPGGLIKNAHANPTTTLSTTGNTPTNPATLAYFDTRIKF